MSVNPVRSGVVSAGRCVHPFTNTIQTLSLQGSQTVSFRGTSLFGRLFLKGAVSNSNFGAHCRAYPCTNIRAFPSSDGWADAIVKLYSNTGTYEFSFTNTNVGTHGITHLCSITDPHRRTESYANVYAHGADVSAATSFESKHFTYV